MPAPAVPLLIQAMPGGAEKLDSLSGPLVNDGQTYEIVFAGMPSGEYRFTCTPHIAFGMNGKVNIR
jgi:plastocyanin